MSETAYRDVVVRTSVEPHPDSAKAFMEFAKQIAKAQEQGQKQSSDAITRAIAEQQAGMQRHLAEAKKINSQLAHSHENVTQTLIRQGKITGKMNAQRIGIENAQLAVIKRSEEAIKKSGAAERAEIEKQRKAYADSRRTISEKNDQVAESAARAMTGIMSIGRGMAMAGLISEENSEKMLKQLIKLQATFDVMRGGIDIIIAGKKAWAGYTAAVEAATVAQAANAAISGATGVSATGAQVGRYAMFGRKYSSAAAGIAGGAGTIAATRMLSGGAEIGLGARMVGLGAKGGPVGAAIIGTLAALTSGVQTGQDVSKYGLGGGAEPGSWRESVAKSTASLAEWTNSLLDSVPGLKAIEDAVPGLRALNRGTLDWISANGINGKEAEETRRRTLQDQANREARQREGAHIAREIHYARAMRDVRLGSMRDESGLLSPGMAQRFMGNANARVQKWFNPNLAANTPGLEARQGAALKDQQQGYKELLAIQKKMRDTARDEATERVRAARDALQLTKETLEKDKEKYKIYKRMYMSDKERFGLLPASEQRELIRIKQKADSGRILTKDETKKIGTMSLSAAQDIRSRFANMYAEKADYDKYFAHKERTGMKHLERSMNVSKGKLQAGITFDNGLTVTLGNAEKMAKQFGDLAAQQFKPQIARLMKGMEANMLHQLKLEMEQIMIRNASQNSRRQISGTVAGG